MVAVLALGGGPAIPQTSSDSVAVPQGFPLPLDQPPRADTGKPHLFAAPPVLSPPEGCAAALDCRVRVIGAIQRNGAVTVETSVLKW